MNVSRATQTGAVLYVVLVMLLMTTMLATTAMLGTVTRGKAAVAHRQSELALMGADSALRVAEDWIYKFYERSAGEALTGSLQGANQVFLPTLRHSDEPARRFWTSNAWVDTRGVEVTDQVAAFTDAVAGNGTLRAQPRYLIEDLGPLAPATGSSTHEGGLTGTTGYASWMTPAGNDELRVYRITGKSRGPAGPGVRTVVSTFAGRAKG